MCVLCFICLYVYNMHAMPLGARRGHLGLKPQAVLNLLWVGDRIVLRSFGRTARAPTPEQSLRTFFFLLFLLIFKQSLANLPGLTLFLLFISGRSLICNPPASAPQVAVMRESFSRALIPFLSAPPHGLPSPSSGS